MHRTKCQVFILGLSDSYTKEKLFQLQPKKDKTTVEFDDLARAASEIQQAKDNCLEVGAGVCGVSGGQAGGGKKKPKQLAACHRCNTTSHSDKGFTLEVREKFCKAFKAKCKKSDMVNHFTDQCFKGMSFPGKKAKVSVLTAEEAVTETAAPAAAELSAVSTAPATTLNSVEQAQPYQFNPKR